MLTFDLNSGEQISSLEVALPEGFDPQNMHGDGLFDGKILAHSFQVSASEEPSKLFYCAVDTQTGEVQLLSFLYQDENGSYYPDTIAAETSGQLLFAYAQEIIPVHLPDGSIVSYPYYQYALMDKDAFWNNREDYTVVSRS